MEENTQAPDSKLNETNLSKRRRTTWRRETRGLLLLYGVFAVVNAVIATLVLGSGVK